MIVTLGFNSATFLEKGAAFAIEKSGLDIKIGEIKGGLYSGLEIKDFNYQDDVKADLKLDIDFPSLKDGIVKVNEVNLSNLAIDKDFLASLIKPTEGNESTEKKGESFIKEIIVDKLHLDTRDIVYEEYILHSLVLDVNDFSFDMKEKFSGDIKAKIASNVALADLDIKLSEGHYDVHLDADVEKAFIEPYLKDTNITLEAVPHIMIDAVGDMENVVVDAKIGEGILYHNAIMISPKMIDLHADVGIKSGDIKADAKADIDSDMAELLLNADATLNTNDINNTLLFSLNSQIEGHQEFVEKLLTDQNVTIVKLPSFSLEAKGDLKNVAFSTKLKEGEIHYESYKVFPKALDIVGNFDLVKQDLEAKLLSQIDSNVANVDLNSQVSVSLKDINQTLSYKSEGKIIAQSAYLKSQMKDANVSVDKLSPLTIMIEGDAKALDVDFDLDGEMRYGELKIKPEIKNSKVHFDFVEQALNSAMHIMIASNKGDITLNSDVALQLEDINNTLRYKADMKITNAKAYAGVDLSYLGDIMIDAEGSLKKLNAHVKSQKINADVVSSDFDTFDLKLDTKKIYLGKIYADVPPDFKKSFVAIKADGFYKLKGNEAKIKAKLKGFKYNRHTLYTNTFTVALKGEDITLSPMILRSDKFKLTMDAKKVGNDVVANIKNRAFFAKAKLNLDPLNVKADGEISSIKALLKEIDKIYPVDTSMGIDGAVKFKARMQGEAVKADISSSKITFKEGRLEKLHILALYEPHIVRIKNFDFKLAGFEGKGMNRQVKLAREGIITFDEENASVDVELENLLFFKGKKEGDVTTGRFKTKTLALSYPGYGETKVTTDLEMYQSGDKMAVTGEVCFKETEVNYQSRFLDVSKDSDIIIVSKKDKKKTESDNFHANTFLDIKIVSDDAIVYKVDDGEIEMQPDMVVRKDFGEAQKITGKIKILGGTYDFADKRFEIKEGAVAFRGQAGTNPLLDLHVAYDEIDDVLIMIDIGGDKNRPKLSFTSEPKMSKKDIFSYLLFGMSASETEGAATSANKAAEKIFGRAVAKDLARELHLDRLDMNRNQDGGIDVKAGKKVNRKSIVYYQNKSTESSVIYERKISKNWEVATEVGKLGQSVDFVYRKGFK